MEYLTTREVAQLLRLSEKKVYGLLERGQLPATRVSGKWLFPKELLERWLAECTIYPSGGVLVALLDAVLLVQGSDDLLFDRALDGIRADLGVAVTSAPVGSSRGLAELRAGRTHIASFHLTPGEAQQRLADEACYQVELVRREQVLACRAEPGCEVRSLREVVERGLRFAARQPGSGTERLVAHHLAAHDLAQARLSQVGRFPTHLTAALAVRTGQADATICSRAAASACGLSCVPFLEEDFRLAIPARLFGHPTVARFLELLLGWLRSPAAAGLPGYRFDYVGRLTAPCLSGAVTREE